MHCMMNCLFWNSVTCNPYIAGPQQLNCWVFLPYSSSSSLVSLLNKPQGSYLRRSRTSIPPYGICPVINTIPILYKCNFGKTNSFFPSHSSRYSKSRQYPFLLRNRSRVSVGNVVTIMYILPL